MENQILELYKVYIDMTDKHSTRRGQANMFFLSLLSGVLLGLLAIVEKGLFINIQKVLFFSTSFVGLAMCYLWYNTLKSYKNLSDAKFKVIEELEAKLEYKPFMREWEVIKSSHEPLTNIESALPFLFGLPYILLLINTFI